MGHTPEATADTIYEVHAHHSLVVVTYADAGWTIRHDGTSQGRQPVFIAHSELLQGKESNMSLISWHSSRLRRVARSSSAAETPSADGDDEAVHTRLCSKKVLFGQLDLPNWQSEARQIPAALVEDCRGVYDALARSSSLVLAGKARNLAWKRLRSNRVLLSAARRSLVSFRGTAGRCGNQKTLTKYVLLGNCSFVVVFGGNCYTTPNLNLRLTVHNVDLKI